MKLKWWKDTDGCWTDKGADKMKVFRAMYGDKDILVYPVKLIDKKFSGWEYRIGDNHLSFDSFSETSHGEGDHAKDEKTAMKWAEETIEEMKGE